MRVSGDEERAEPVGISREGSHSSQFTHVEVTGIEKSRERLDLFIDLIWVGIISNLSEVYSNLYFDPEQARGTAALVFVLTFLPSWRIWNILREFMSNFYMDDILQRLFVFWILVLSVFYGNNLAYLTEDIPDIKIYCISIYLFIRCSFFIMEMVYSIWIPWLRRLMLVGFVLMLPITGLWVSAIYINGVKAVAPIACALVWEYFMPVVLEQPRVAKLLIPSEYYKAIDPHHTTSRFSSFYVITLGEGVLQLISRGPLGIGISGTAGTSVWGLCLYFLLAFLYFNRDQSKTVIPAVRRRGWRVIIWIL